MFSQVNFWSAETKIIPPINALNGSEFFEANTQSSQALSSFLIIKSPICSFRNATHIAEWFAKSPSMDKLIPAQKATPLTERFPFQLCRHIVGILYEQTVSSSTKELCQQKLHRRRGRSGCAALPLAGVALCWRNDSVYLPT